MNPQSNHDIKQISMYLNNAKVGDTVTVECVSGLGTGGISKITEITTLYDEYTGQPFKLIWCDEHSFDSRTGNAWNRPTGYYIDSVQLKEDEICCNKMRSELAMEHIILLKDGRFFLGCMNPIKFCPFCGITLNATLDLKKGHG